jgi:hypothetical protein
MIGLDIAGDLYSKMNMKFWLKRMPVPATKPPAFNKSSPG